MGASLLTTPACELGPAPKRSRTGLAAQFTLQFVYIPLWLLFSSCLAVVLILRNLLSDDSYVPTPGIFRIFDTAISWRRLCVEWRGRAEDWEPFTEELLTKRFAPAERDNGWATAELPPSGVRLVRAWLPVKFYRGLAPAQVDEIAHRHGWSVDWEVETSPRARLHFFRLVPPPEHVGVPDPYGPPAAPGTPWGPQPARLVLPLLTFLFLPRLRLLELRDNPDAYLAHLRRSLPDKITAELARDRNADYLTDEDGRVLRRIILRSWHFRGVGAHAVLHLAEEYGWQLDHSFPADPAKPLRLCRLD